MPSPSPIQRDELNRLIGALLPLCNEFQPAAMCWIGDGDAGPDYCRECAALEVTRLKTADPASTVFVDGGWDESRESDGHAACTTCGRTLQHSLTQFGFEDEVAHCVDSEFNRPTDPEVAYSVVKILEAAAWSERSDLIQRALDIGQKAEAALPGVIA